MPFPRSTGQHRLPAPSGGRHGRLLCWRHNAAHLLLRHMPPGPCESRFSEPCWQAEEASSAAITAVPYIRDSQKLRGERCTSSDIQFEPEKANQVTRQQRVGAPSATEGTTPEGSLGSIGLGDSWGLTGVSVHEASSRVHASPYGPLMLCLTRSGERLKDLDKA